MARNWVVTGVAVIVLLMGATPIDGETQPLSPHRVVGTKASIPTPTPIPATIVSSSQRHESCFPRSRDRVALRPRMERRLWSTELRDVVGGQNVGIAVAVGNDVAFGHHASVQRTPASNQKLLLSMALLEVFGPHARIATKARVGRAGNVLVVGHGDPTFGDARYRAALGLRGSSVDRLARRMTGSGIRRVRRVIGVGIGLARDWDAPGWQPYVKQTYVTRPTALSYNGNQATAAPPERRAARALTDALERAGADVAGEPGIASRVVAARTIATVRSPPLVDLIGIMNRDSSNFVAEVLGKVLGARCYGTPGTIAKGARAIAAWARSMGAANVTARDAAGLSYANRVSPRQMVTFLATVATRPWAPHLRRGLPGPGEGTLAGRLPGVRVAAKTGSLFNGASALSGWVWMERSRRWAAFSIMSSLGAGGPALEDRVVRILAGL